VKYIKAVAYFIRNKMLTIFHKRKDGSTTRNIAE